MRRTLANLQWPLLGLLAVTASVLGFIGFVGFFQALGEPRSGLDVIYLTLQLFVLESGSVSGPVPWQLEVARLLAPAVAGYAAVRALALLFREQIEGFRIRYLKGHVVISALGRKGLLLAQALREGGEQVVIIEADAENDFIETAREYGALILIGDARDPRVLTAAGTTRARQLVAVSGDDGINAEVAVRARALMEDRGRRPLSCLVHVVDPDLCSLLRMQEIGRTRDGGLRLDFFNVFEGGARALLRDHPVVTEPSTADPSRIHAVVVGFGKFGQNLVLQAARQWRTNMGSNAGPLPVTVVDRAAVALTESLQARYPWLHQACRIHAMEVSFESRDFAEGTFLFDLSGALSVSSIYVCLDDDSQGITTALTLHRLVKGRGVPVVVRMVHGAGLGSLLGEETSADGEFSGLHAFGLLDQMCDPDTLFAGVFESLARAIHEEYLNDREKHGLGQGTSPFLAPWEELGEEDREASRAQAAHIGVKMAAVGCELLPLTDWEAEDFRFGEEEVERLAEMEHGRWVEERRSAGWTLGPRDDVRRKSPNLVPWGELPEESKELDRVFVRGLPRFLASAGFQIGRRAPTSKVHPALAQ